MATSHDNRFSSADDNNGSRSGHHAEIRRHAWTCCATPSDISFGCSVERDVVGVGGGIARGVLNGGDRLLFSSSGHRGGRRVDSNSVCDIGRLSAGNFGGIAINQGVVPEGSNVTPPLYTTPVRDNSFSLENIKELTHSVQTAHAVRGGGGVILGGGRGGDVDSSSSSPRISNGTFSGGDGLTGGHEGGISGSSLPIDIDTAESRCDISGEFGEGHALVYQARSITPKVMLLFVGSRPTKSANDTSLEFVDAETMAKLRSGRLELRWAVCNPFCDKRLRRGLPLLFGHVAAVTVAVFTVAVGASFWTSAAANFETGASSLGARDHSNPCERSRSRGELRALLLSIDGPMFVSLAVGFTLTMANITGLRQLRRAVLAGLLVSVVALCGMIVIILGDPFQLWGVEGSLGFAGVWVGVQILISTILISMGATWGSREDRVIPKRWAAAGFGLVLFSSATALQANLYFVEFLKATGLHPLFGISALFSVILVIALVIKATFRTFTGVPPWACAVVLYWFEAGAHLSLRLYLHSQTDHQIMAMKILAAAICEMLVRVMLVVSGKAIYNHCVRVGQPDMALRVLDLHIASLSMGIFAEWAAIAVAAGLDFFGDHDLFEGLTMSQTNGEIAVKVAIEGVLELGADAFACLFTLALLPISLEGLLRARARLVSEVSFVFATSVFLFSTLNMRVRIGCFEA